MKKYYIKTYGCQMNVKDSQDISATLSNLGLEEARKPNEADVIILNSCSVRQASEDKVYGFGKKYKPGYSQNGSIPIREYPEFRKPITILTGCMVGSAVGERKRYEIEYIKNKIPWVNYFLSQEEVSKIPNILVKEGLINNTFNTLRVEKGLFDKSKLREPTAYINISTGCDNFCTFCVVPYARGCEISKSKKEVLDEVTKLVDKGYSEITLLGQNVNSWGLSKEEKSEIRIGSKKRLPFANLLREVHKIDGVKKISFLSSNPFDFTRDLIDTLKLPKISRYIHIAVQSGDNEILKKMNRKHTVKEFKSLIQKIRKAVFDIEIGTDIIVGFPGETRKQFENTVKLCKEIKFNVVYIAAYSERLGTIAQKIYKDSVPLKEKKRRLKRLRDTVNNEKKVS